VAPSATPKVESAVTVGSPAAGLVLTLVELICIPMAYGKGPIPPYGESTDVAARRAKDGQHGEMGEDALAGSGLRGEGPDEPDR
jgi:hypothetical protein